MKIPCLTLIAAFILAGYLLPSSLLAAESSIRNKTAKPIHGNVKGVKYAEWLSAERTDHSSKQLLSSKKSKPTYHSS